jgi:hypothetical protein
LLSKEKIYEAIEGIPRKVWMLSAYRSSLGATGTTTIFQTAATIGHLG